MNSNTFTIILTSVLLFLMLVCIFIYAFFPVSYSASDVDYFRVDFNDVQLVNWHVGSQAFDLIYYDYIGEQPVIVAYYDINYYDSNNVLAFDLIKPTLVVIYKVDELPPPVDPREFSSLKLYIESNPLYPLSLVKEDVYRAFLLPPSVNPNLTQIDDPFYITRYYQNNGKMPRFYSVENIGFNVSVGSSGVPYDYNYTLYLSGQGYINCAINSENLLGGALFTFGNSLKTMHYPRFNWDYENATDLLQFFPSLYRFGEDCVEYIFMLVSSFFYSFSPFYYLR